jgi:hypothetical protein
LKSGWHILVQAPDDQALAAERKFHPYMPQVGGTETMSIRRFSDHRSELPDGQPKNGLTDGFVALLPAPAKDVTNL